MSARIRSIHPGLFTDEALSGISEAAVLFLIGLLTEADDHGVFEWKPKQLRIRLRPARDGDVDPLLSELIEAKAIRPFMGEDSRQYGAIRNFCKWQRPQRPVYHFPLPDHLQDWVKATGKPQSQAEGYMVIDLCKKQGGRCAYCPTDLTHYQKKANSLHVVERNPGIGLTAENAVGVCKSCRDSKGSLPETEFLTLREQSVATVSHSENSNSHRDTETVASENTPEKAQSQNVAVSTDSENTPENGEAPQRERREEKEEAKEGGEKSLSRESRAKAPPKKAL